MHANVISANKLGGIVHHDDNVSNSRALEFHGNWTESFRNLYLDFVACRNRDTIFESYLKEVPKGISWWSLHSKPINYINFLLLSLASEDTYQAATTLKSSYTVRAH